MNPFAGMSQISMQQLQQMQQMQQMMGGLGGGNIVDMGNGIKGVMIPMQAQQGDNKQNPMGMPMMMPQGMGQGMPCLPQGFPQSFMIQNPQGLMGGEKNDQSKQEEKAK